jgi:hypothetical protein
MHLLSRITVTPPSTPVFGAHLAAPVAVQGWDLLLTLLRHPKIVASASAFRQQSPELIDTPEDRGTPPSPRSVQDQTVHQKEGGNTPVTPAVTWSEPASQAEPGPSSREHSQVNMYCLLKALRLSGRRPWLKPHTSANCGLSLACRLSRSMCLSSRTPFDGGKESRGAFTRSIERT